MEKIIGELIYYIQYFQFLGREIKIVRLEERLVSHLKFLTVLILIKILFDLGYFKEGKETNNAFSIEVN